MKVILASQSPRRRELMDLGKIDYEIIVSNFDEKVEKKFNLEDQSKEIAYGKAREVFDNTQGNRIVIGSDSLVILDGEQLGTPKDREDAVQMLKKIQGRDHTVYTSIAVLVENEGEYKEYKELHQAKVFIKKMTDEEIDRYVDSDEPYDKAGAYGVQTSFAVFVERIEGEYSVVVGLPLCRVYEILKENNGI